MNNAKLRATVRPLPGSFRGLLLKPWIVLVLLADLGDVPSVTPPGYAAFVVKHDEESDGAALDQV
jgi:hypothetical protein